jgi:peptidoglycan/xylan/chitin deacetylase (PgdA/CDA1 family)
MKACLTIDMEDFDDSVIWSKTNKKVDVARACDQISGLLDKHNIRATLFFLGTFAEKHKDIVKGFRKDGHEIACHFYEHKNLYPLKENEIITGIKRCKKLLGPMKGFRAPVYSIHKVVLDVLKKEGFSYDSSVFPSFIYPHPSIKKLKNEFRVWEIKGQPYNVDGVLEIPITVFPSYIGLPITGTTIRIYGKLIARLLRFYTKEYFVFNLHPFEFIEVPKVNGAPFWFRRNTGKGFISNLENIITVLKRLDAEFITMNRVKQVED